MTTPFRIDGSDGSVDLINLIGGQLEIVARADAPNADMVLTRVSVAPGGSVPLHSHSDYECFHVVSGQLDVFVEPHGWTRVTAGQSAVLAKGERHAIRNVTNDPVELAVVINNRLARFFQEAGDAGVRGEPPAPPTPEKIARVLATAERYGYWMASPDEQASITGDAADNPTVPPASS